MIGAYACITGNMHIVMHNVVYIVMHNAIHRVLHILVHNVMHSVLHERRLRMHSWQYAYCNA